MRPLIRIRPFRPRLPRALLALTVCGALWSFATPAPLASAPTAVREPQVRGYSYGPHKHQTVTAYTDSGGPPLMILHGGAWLRDTDWSGVARWFAARGFTVYDTDYRLSSDATWAAQRADVRTALAWVAARHDNQRPLILGSSAGGQLAAMAGAYGAGATRVRGVAALSPVASPHRAWKDGGRPGATRSQRRLRNAAQRLAGCAPTRCPKTWADMDVAQHASGASDAPMLLIHSERDFVPVTHAQELAAAERRKGAKDVRVRVVDGAAHGGPLLRVAGVRDAVLRWLRARG
ncbi:alpha/beta hydrolase family protein [Streptomyces sp. NPDC002851]